MSTNDFAANEARKRREKRLSGGRAPTAEYLESMPVADRNAMVRENAERQRHMAAPGALPHVTGLLEQRRLDYNIPDHAFDAQASFGFVMVHQITRMVGETFGDSSIIATKLTQDRETKEAPRGIIVSAGLDALDKLRSNGIDLGHIVMFSRSVPYRASMGFCGLTEQKLIILHTGDIFASEDTATALLDGEARICTSEPDGDGYRYHSYRDQHGSVWNPIAAKKGGNT